MKIANLREIRMLCPENSRQIEVRSALLSQNVNKLSRVFSLFVAFSKDFLLNSCWDTWYFKCARFFYSYSIGFRFLMFVYCQFESKSFSFTSGSSPQNRFFATFVIDVLCETFQKPRIFSLIDCSQN